MIKPIKLLLAPLFALAFSAIAMPNSIVAIVNDDLITLDSIIEDTKPSFTKAQKMQLLDQKIDLILQLQEIKKIGIEPKAESVNTALNNIASQNGLNLTQLKTNVQFGEIYNNVINQLSLIGLKQIALKKADIQLTAAEVKAELAKNKKPSSSNTLKKQVKIAQIAIDSIDQTDSLLKSKDVLIKQLLTGLSDKINKGESFSSLAKLHSQDPSYKNGGESDWLMMDDLPAVFKKEIDKLSKGKLSKPFKVGQGWKIIKIIDTREHIDTKEIDTHIRNIKIKLIKIKQNSYFKKWVKTLRKGAYIEIFDHKL